MPWDEMKTVTDLCHEELIPVHLDGARLYMMSAATGISIIQYTELFDSIYVSSYKYFGAPFGGILAGTKEFIKDMFNDRRMFGGGIPFGYIAAALSLDGVDGFRGDRRSVGSPPLRVLVKAVPLGLVRANPTATPAARPRPAAVACSNDEVFPVMMIGGANTFIEQLEFV